MISKLNSMKTWGWSAGKRPISLFSSKELSELASLSPLLFIGGMHGDEPEGVDLAEGLLEDLQNFEGHTKPWILIPCINPDGIAAKTRVNSNGVDLNRNFPSKCWSNEHSKARYYPGKNPGSEPETKLLVDLIESQAPSLIIHFHSWKPMVIFSNQKAEPAAKIISSTSGYELKNEIGYPTPGSLGEFAGVDLDIGVICIEEQDEQASEERRKIYPRFRSGLRQILDFRD